MAKLVYTAIMSLDGYVADANGQFDWSAPDEEVHAFVNDLERPIGTYLTGRRLYDVMKVWESWDTSAEPAVIQDYATIWRAAEKVVHSKSLRAVSTTKTRIERSFDADAVCSMKASAKADISVGGAELAGQALKLGLVDECSFFLSPIAVGGGKRALPENVRIQLELIDQRRFGNGVVYVHYRVHH
jgi:dihydrofolate reductase